MTTQNQDVFSQLNLAAIPFVEVHYIHVDFSHIYNTGHIFAFIIHVHLECSKRMKKCFECKVPVESKGIRQRVLMFDVHTLNRHLL